MSQKQIVKVQYNETLLKFGIEPSSKIIQLKEIIIQKLQSKNIKVSSEDENEEIGILIKDSEQVYLKQKVQDINNNQ